MSSTSVKSSIQSQSNSYGSMAIDMRARFFRSVDKTLWEVKLALFLNAFDLLRLKVTSKEANARINHNNRIWQPIAQKEFGLIFPVNGSWQTSVLSIIGLGRRPPDTINFGKLTVRGQIHALISNGRIAIAGRNNTVYLLNPAQATKPPVGLEARDRPICMTRLKQDQLAVGSSGGYVDVWNTENASSVVSTQRHKGDITDITELGDGRLVTSSIDTTVCVWDPNDLLGVDIVLEHEFAVQRTIIESKNILITLVADNCICLWNINQPKEPLAVLRGHTNRVLTAKLFPNRKLVTGSLDGTARVWDLSRPSEPPRTLLHAGSSVGQCQMLDGGRLLTIDQAHPLPVARTWNLKWPNAPEKLTTLRTNRVSVLHDGRVAELGLSRNVLLCGKKISQCDQLLQVLDVNSERTVSTGFDDHCIDWLIPLPDGRHLIVDSNSEVMLHHPGMTPLENSQIRRGKQIGEELGVRSVQLVLLVALVYGFCKIIVFLNSCEGCTGSDGTIL
jgi:hypothetical protein